MRAGGAEFRIQSSEFRMGGDVGAKKQEARIKKQEDGDGILTSEF